MVASHTTAWQSPFSGQIFCAACVVIGNVYLTILKSNDQLSLPHICYAGLNHIMFLFLSFFVFFYFFGFAFLFGFYFNLTSFVLFSGYIATCFWKRFFIQWGSFVEYYLIRGVVGQSLFYCFGSCLIMFGGWFDCTFM